MDVCFFDYFSTEHAAYIEESLVLVEGFDTGEEAGTAVDELLFFLTVEDATGGTLPAFEDDAHVRFMACERVE